MKYLVYCRKSTESEDRQVLSLPAQENELASIAKQESFDVVSKYQESMSAKRSGRPIFNQLLKRIENGKGYSLLVWNIDRLARNMVDGGMILQFMDEGKIIEIRTFEKTYRNTPDDKFMMALSFGIAKKYVDDLSVNVKRGITEKLKRGEWPNRAPFGYLNDWKTKTVVVDPATSGYVLRIYDLYTCGSQSLDDIADTLYAEGLRSKSGKKVFPSHIHHVLNNPFYTGVMMRHGKCFEGKHEALIPKRVFDEAQAIMKGFGRPRPQRLFFPLRGYIVCETCGCMFTATLQKGHHYYYCTNGRGKCQAHKKYLRERDLYSMVAGLFDLLVFSERKIDLMYRAAKVIAEREGGDTVQVLTRLRGVQESLKGRESRLLDAFIADQIGKELYDEKSAALQHERIEIEKQIREAESRQGVSTLEPTLKIFQQANTAKKEFLAADDVKKRIIVENLLSNLSIENQKLAKVQFKMPFDIIAKAHKNTSISSLLGD